MKRTNNSRNKTIYVSSQYFGYGPTSNLYSVLGHLKANNKHLFIKAIENEGIKIFNERKPGIINKLVKKIDYHDADLALSSFDPYLILYAWYHNIPSVYCCNLFWFWNVHHNPEAVLKKKTKLLQLKEKETYSTVLHHFQKIHQQNPHQAIFLGYLLADYCIVRKFKDIDSYIKPFTKHLNIMKSGILIPVDFQPSKQVNRNNKTVFFQLSGSINPIVRLQEHITYLRLIQQLIDDLASCFSDMEFIFCTNPHFESYLTAFKNPNAYIKTTVSQVENLTLMESSLALFTSPGIDTIYEATYIKCPTFLLPEQSAGQYPIVTLLRSSGFQLDGFLIDDEFDRTTHVGEDDAHDIYRYIKVILEKNGIYDKFLDKSKAFIKKMNNQIEREKYTNFCSLALTSYMGKEAYNAGSEIAKYIVDILDK